MRPGRESPAAGRLLALACASWMACAGGQKPNQPVVKSLDIEGTKQVSEGDIKDKILTTSSSWLPGWVPFFGHTGYFDPNSWQADLRRIERYYQAQGFYQAEVVDAEVTPTDGNAVRAKVTVQEGKATRIDRIDIEGLEDLPPDFSKRLVTGLSVKKGDIFKEQTWEGLKGELQQRLHDLGYAEAQVGGEAFVEITNQTARIRLVAAPGQRYKFGNVFVATGPHPQVKVRQIIDQAQGAIRKGAWFNDPALDEAQKRVFKMGVFGAVKVNPGNPDRINGVIPVVVDVRESPFHTIRYGAGIGIDPARQETRLIAEYTDRNFLGDLRRLTLRGKLGYAFIPSVFSITSSGPIFDALIEFEQPHFLARDFRFQASLNGYRDIQEAFTYIGARAKLGVIWQPHSSFSIFPSYNFEIDRIGGQTNGLIGTAPALAYGCNFDNGQSCIQRLSFLEQIIEWDRRNDRAEPTKGFYLSLSLQEGGGFLGGNYGYFRIFPDARSYVSFGRFTLATKLRGGTLLTNQTSPIVERFFSGGGSFNRGFGSRRLSPLLPVPSDTPPKELNPLVGSAGDPQLGRPQVAGRYVPVGGNGLFDATVELRYNLTSSLILATFLDLGWVTRDSFDFGVLFSQMQYAVGIGVRYKTIVGPIRVDLAYVVAGPPLYVYPTNGTISAPSASHCLAFGGNVGRTEVGSPEGRCSFQISVGEAF